MVVSQSVDGQTAQGIRILFYEAQHVAAKTNKPPNGRGLTFDMLYAISVESMAAGLEQLGHFGGKVADAGGVALLVVVPGYDCH